MSKTFTHTDGTSGATTINHGDVNVTQTAPTNLNANTTSSTINSSVHDSTTTVNGVVTNVHTENWSNNYSIR